MYTFYIITVLCVVIKCNGRDRSPCRYLLVKKSSDDKALRDCHHVIRCAVPGCYISHRCAR